MLQFLFHQQSKHVTTIDPDPTTWPLDWKEVQYKEYEGAVRYPLLPLGNSVPAGLLKPYWSVITARRTNRELSPVLFTFETLSSLVSASVAQTNRELSGEPVVKTRLYPSAGARYPLELYVLLQAAVGDLPAGLYHYAVSLHALELLEVRDVQTVVKDTCDIPWVQSAPVVLILTAVFPRTLNKYQERGYRFVLQEVGLVSSLIINAATSLDCSAVPIGATDDTLLEQYLDIDGVSESVVSVIAVGSVV